MRGMERARFTIVGIGEALFDLFPDREALGGAPVNLALAAHQLAAPHGGRGVLVSRVGQDAHGDRVAETLAARGMTTDYLQWDPDHETGKVFVDLQAGPERPGYEIAPAVAWDQLQFDPDMAGLARASDGIGFGSLAHRTAQSRNAIRRFLAEAPRATRLFDVNLRAPHSERRILARSCEIATAVKASAEEMAVLDRELGLDARADPAAAAERLRRRYRLELVAVTRGAGGTELFTAEGRFAGSGAGASPFEPVAGANAVGAGDACAAGLLVGRALRWPWQRIADLADAAGAFVASRAEATPDLPESIAAPP